MNTLSVGFYPNSNLDEKSNYKRFEIVERDGSLKSRIVLNIVDPSVREQVICKHFLSRHVMWFKKAPTPVRYIDRDNPWDFTIDLGGEIIKIELTAVSDNEALFTKMKYEDRIMGLVGLETIEFHELQKMQYAFPDKTISKLIEEGIKNEYKKDTLVKNPFYQNDQFVFFSNISEINSSFGDLLKEVLEKKTNKKHSDKNEVILIIDNRTILFEQDDVLKAIGDIEGYIETTPFKEIWIYTGYYSDLDGNNSEYSLLPIKISEEKYQILNKLLNK